GEVYSCRQAGLDRSDRREMLLIPMIRLEPLLVRRRVLGTDQGIRGSVLFGLEVQVALVSTDLVFEMLSMFFLGAEAMYGLGRIFQESFQFGAVRARAGDGGRAAEVGRFPRDSSRERLQLLPARGEPLRQSRGGLLD